QPSWRKPPKSRHYGPKWRRSETDGGRNGASTNADAADPAVSWPAVAVGRVLACHVDHRRTNAAVQVLRHGSGGNRLQGQARTPGGQSAATAAGADEKGAGA